MITLITADAARKITEDIFNNKIGEDIPKVMSDIITTAQRGNNVCYYYPPSCWGESQEKAFGQFFENLGYLVEYHRSIMRISW